MINQSQNNETKILICRVSWMKTYRKINEKGVSGHRYVQEGYAPHESLNFKPYKELYYGYVPCGGDQEGNHGKLNINRLGAKSSNQQISGITVVFCATHPDTRKLLVVGYYTDATVYRVPIDHPKLNNRIVRFTAKNAHLVLEHERVFEIPKAPQGVGQKDIWYGLEERQRPKVKKRLIKYIGDEGCEPPAEKLKEVKRLKKHIKQEGRANVRHLIFEKGFKCEACEWALPDKNSDIWQSSFEVHHLKPFADLPAGKSRILKAEDFAILCSNCHRAIHRTEFIGDVKKFKAFISKSKKTFK